jgi:hypothetical protein
VPAIAKDSSTTDKPILPIETKKGKKGKKG